MASPKKLSHIVLQTNRRREMIDWYCTVLGAEVLYDAERISFISYDDEHHRVAFLDPGPLSERKPDAAGLNHVAFTFGDLDNQVELLVDNFPIAAEGKAYMRQRSASDKNPVGVAFDPEELVERARAGLRV